MRDHDRSAVAAQGVLSISANRQVWDSGTLDCDERSGTVSYLQQTGQLAVPVVDILGAVLVAQSVDAVAQSQEGTVNVGPLFQTLTSVLSLNDTFCREANDNKSYTQLCV